MAKDTYDLSPYLERYGYSRQLFVERELWQKCIATTGATQEEVDRRSRRLALSAEIIFQAMQQPRIPFVLDLEAEQMSQLELEVEATPPGHRYTVRLRLAQAPRE